MTVKVFEHPLSPYAQKVKLALHFKGVAYEVETPAIGVDAENFLAISPRGEVPVLVHDDVTLYHSAVIGAYIDETWPEPPLLTGSAVEKARVRLLEEAMDTHFEGNTWGLGEILIFGRASGDEAERMCRFAEEEIRGWYAWLESELSDDDWFSGAEYSWADICVVPFVNGAGRFEIWPEEGTRLAGWLEQVNGREDVHIVTEAAKAAELDPELMQAAIRSGFKREYRDHRLEWMIRAGGLDIVANGIAEDTIRFNGPFQ
jgi:glutathione S-transferase/RNA polymerase-associated protein